MSSPEHIVAVLKGKLGGLFKAFNDEISSAYWFSLFDPVGDADKQWDLLNLRNQIVLTNKKFDMLVDKCELGLHPKIRDRWNDFLQLYVERYEFDKNEIFGKGSGSSRLASLGVIHLGVPINRLPLMVCRLE